MLKIAKMERLSKKDNLNKVKEILLLDFKKMNKKIEKGDNMEYIVGKTAGFCFGVRNAVESAKKSIQEEPSMYCLGEIVHNKEVVHELEDMGMEFIDDISENTDEKTTIIRAHGVSKEIYEIAEQKNIKLIDLTCPFVLKIHKMVSSHEKEGYYIFLVGAKAHPETIGTAGFCGKHYSIIEQQSDIEEAIQNFYDSKMKKIFVVVQTTFNMEKFKEFSNIISEEFSNKDDVTLEIENTICLATKERQDETEKMSKEVDFMIIIGGKNSSNTKKLYEISKKNCGKTICIETCDDINVGELEGIKKVGIMAGASTPQSSIEKVINLVENA